VALQYLRITTFAETDFDRIVEQAGGCRFAPDDSREKEPNADYVLNEAVVELKLVEEEGLAKRSRQRRVANLFRKSQPDRPVVVLKPSLLSAAGQQRYDNLVSGPLKTAVKSAARQLEKTRIRLADDKVRVLLLVNNGYSALSREEFERVATKCARNDTKKIDCVVVAGIYHYSDRFDSFFLEAFDLCVINAERPFISHDLLREQWMQLVDDLLRTMMLADKPNEEGRLPVIDLQFDIDGIRYVKPAPKMGRPSPFYGEKRPRENSTGIETCPPVAIAFPKLSADDWGRFKKKFPDASFLKTDHAVWLAFAAKEEQSCDAVRRPFVAVRVRFAPCSCWCEDNGVGFSPEATCKYAAYLFDRQTRGLMESAVRRSESRLVFPSYIYLVTEEIGQDKANDMSSIFHIHELPGTERQEELVRNERIFFEHGLALAAAYAVKRGVPVVVYDRDETHAWV